MWTLQLYTNWKLPPPGVVMLNQLFPSWVVACARKPPLVGVGTSTLPLGGTYAVMVEGTEPPMAAITAMVCGASTVLASPVTVRMAVCGPAVSDAVFSATLMGMHGAATWLVVVQGPAGPTVGTAHGADEVTVRGSAPSPALYASTTRVGPFDPTAMLAGPMVVPTSRNMGAALANGARLRATQLDPRKRKTLRPTREHPSCMPRYTPPPGRPGTRQSRRLRTSRSCDSAPQRETGRSFPRRR